MTDEERARVGELGKAFARLMAARELVRLAVCDLDCAGLSVAARALKGVLPRLEQASNVAAEEMGR